MGHDQLLLSWARLGSAVTQTGLLASRKISHDIPVAQGAAEGSKGPGLLSPGLLQLSY